MIDVMMLKVIVEVVYKVEKFSEDVKIMQDSFYHVWKVYNQKLKMEQNFQL